MEAIAAQIPNCKWLYALPDSPFWNRELPKNKGLDLFDWITENQISKEQVIAAIENQPRQLNLGDKKPDSQLDNVVDLPVDNDNRPSDEILLERLTELANSDLSQSQVNSRLIAISSDLRASIKEVKSLFQTCCSEIEQQEYADETKEEVEQLLQIQESRINLQDYLPPQLARPLEKLAVYLGVNNATLLTVLLTTSASLLPIDTKLELIRATKFYARPIFYSGICAPSGSGKSPAIKAILEPLFTLQSEEEERFNLAQEEYKKDLKNYKKAKNSDLEEPEPPPPPREYFVTDSTSEAIANIQNNQKNNGFLGYFDELKQLLGQSNSYRSGRGADIEKLLSGRDGSGFKVNRASGKRISCSRSGYSILGGIQPGVLRKQMGDFSDSNGFWARFVWVNQPMKRKPFPDDETSINVSLMLRSLYEDLGRVTRDFVLSAKAKDCYRDWYNYVEDKKLSEPKPALQAVWSKTQRLVGEIALLLHCTKYVFEGQQPTVEVDRETMTAAIKLTQFYLGQIKLIHAEGDSENNSISSIYSQVIDLSRRKGWLSARDIKMGIRDYRKKTANQARMLLRKMESLGYGSTKGIGSKLKWNYKTVDNVDEC